MPLIYSRPEKLNHIDTIRYEIYMLRYSYQQLAERTLTGRDAWIYLEAFFLHYRNLIHFLGHEGPRSTDLHITTLWQREGLAEPTNLAELHAAGKRLMAQYEPSDALGGGRISQYLQHCTEKRIEAKDWEVSVMYIAIEPLLSDLDRHLGPETGILNSIPAVESSGMNGPFGQ